MIANTVSRIVPAAKIHHLWVKLLPSATRRGLLNTKPASRHSPERPYCARYAAGMPV